MMMALMAAAATTAFAQDALVKEAKKQFTKGEFDAAAQTLAPALTSAETTDKAAAWNLQAEIMQGKFQDISTLEQKEKVVPTGAKVDTKGMHEAAVGAMQAALKCDEFDRQPNEKGKVKIRFRKDMQAKLQNTRLALINAGLYFYNEKDLDKAFNTWAMYINSAEDPFFEGVDLSQDQYRSEIAYYAGLAAYQNKDYVNAEKYANIAAQDPKKADDASEILLFSKKENLKTPADSAAYVAMVKDLHKQKPEEKRYFNLLMDYYTHARNMVALKAWAEEEIALDAENSMAWALKGEVQMNDREWDGAVESYKKAIEIDPNFVQCIFNAGVCLNSKAIDLKDQLADKKTGGLTKENADKVKAILAESLTFMERAKELDPDREKVNWAYPLYQIYYSLGDKEKSDEMEKLVNSK
jgi:tetratricopeptide (TPR) repeat protein